MADAGGWRPDPYGRFGQRWWDGERWTEHVVTGDGEQLVDPLGTTASVPFATPATALPTPDRPARDDSTQDDSTQAFAAPTTPMAGATTAGSTTSTTAAIGADGGSGGGGNIPALDRLGPDVRRRPDPRWTVVLAGLGGVLVAVGVVVAIVGNDDEVARWKYLLSALLVLGSSLAIRLGIKGQPELRSAAVGAGAVGIFVLTYGITADDLDAEAVPLLLAAALYLVAYLVPGFLGRPLMLGLAAFFLVTGIATMVGDDTTRCEEYFEGGGVGDIPDECFSDGAGDPFDDVVPTGFGDVTDAGVAYLLGGGVLMLGVAALDRRRYHGVATSLVVAGLVASIVGVVIVVADLGGEGGAVLATLVGALICVVGSMGARRATTWWGAVIATAGLVALVGNLIEPDGVGQVAATLIVSGVVLAGIPLLIAMLIANNRRTP